MKTLEQIDKAQEQAYRQMCADDPDNQYSHPESFRWGFERGVEWADKTMIEKACDWLDNNLLKYWGQRTTDPTDFINDFKKAMEE